MREFWEGEVDTEIVGRRFLAEGKSRLTKNH